MVVVVGDVADASTGIVGAEPQLLRKDIGEVPWYVLSQTFLTTSRRHRPLCLCATAYSRFGSGVNPDLSQASRLRMRAVASDA